MGRFNIHYQLLSNHSYFRNVKKNYEQESLNPYVPIWGRQILKYIMMQLSKSYSSRQHYTIVSFNQVRHREMYIYWVKHVKVFWCIDTGHQCTKIPHPPQKKKKSLSVEMAGATSHDIYIAVSTTHCERAAWRRNRTYIFSLIQSLLYGA